MVKMCAAVAALTATMAPIAISSPAAATDYVQTVDASSFGYGTATYWKIQSTGFAVPYNGVDVIYMARSSLDP
jgi:hypothetical protein